MKKRLRIKKMKRLTDEQLMGLAFDYEETDLRYGGGCASLYARMAAHLTSRKEKNFKEKANAFLDKTSQFHEKNRWNFQIHPDWRKELGVGGRNG
jgi:hypothetical protein